MGRRWHHNHEPSWTADDSNFSSHAASIGRRGHPFPTVAPALGRHQIRKKKTMGTRFPHLCLKNAGTMHRDGGRSKNNILYGKLSGNLASVFLVRYFLDSEWKNIPEVFESCILWHSTVLPYSKILQDLGWKWIEALLPGWRTLDKNELIWPVWWCRAVFDIIYGGSPIIFPTCPAPLPPISIIL